MPVERACQRILEKGLSSGAPAWPPLQRESNLITACPAVLAQALHWRLGCSYGACTPACRDCKSLSASCGRLEVLSAHSTTCSTAVSNKVRKLSRKPG